MLQHPETPPAELRADRQWRYSFVVGSQGFGDAGERGAVAVLLQACQALLCMGELLQAVQPEVEMLWSHLSQQALVQLSGHVMVAL